MVRAWRTDCSRVCRISSTHLRPLLWDLEYVLCIARSRRPRQFDHVRDTALTRRVLIERRLNFTERARSPSLSVLLSPFDVVSPPSEID